MKKNKVKRTKSAGGLVMNSQGRILVVSQRGRSWSLPKGHRKKGESREATARREIFEETGISRLDRIILLGTYSRYRIGSDGQDDRRKIKVITLFYFRTRQRQLRPQEAHTPEARWVKPHQVADLLTHPKDQWIFERYWRKARKHKP